MFKANTLALSICTAFALSGCATLGELSDKLSHSVSSAQDQDAGLGPLQLYERAKQHQAHGRYALAITDYQHALERDRALADAHNGLGIIYSQQGRYDQALAEFNAAIALKPDAGYLHNNLGYVLLLEGQNQEALNVLETAVALEPDNEKAAFNLQFARVRLGMSLQMAPKQPTEVAESVRQPRSALPPETSTDRLQLIALAPNVYELKAREEIVPLAPASVEAEVPLREPPQRARPFRLEISNGNGAKGMARQVAAMLDRNGIHANRITNHVTFRQPMTEIQYRHGYQAEAIALRDMVPAQLKAVPDSALRKNVQVRVLLGKDARSVAWISGNGYAVADATRASANTTQR